MPEIFVNIETLFRSYMNSENNRVDIFRTASKQPVRHNVHAEERIDAKWVNSHLCQAEGELERFPTWPYHCMDHSHEAIMKLHRTRYLNVSLLHVRLSYPCSHSVSYKEATTSLQPLISQRSLNKRWVDYFINRMVQNRGRDRDRKSIGLHVS